MLNKTSKQFSFFGVDDIGQRANQEDYFSFCEEENGALLLVLADGMGGHSAGEVASRIAVESFIRSFRELSTGSLSGKLSISLERANGEIKRGALEDPSRAGMGCTIVAAYLAEQGLSWASVGDSMLMLVRGGTIQRLNADHSMAPLIEASLKQGRITPEEAASHPQRNALRSALTGDHLGLVDISNASFPLQAGDCLISASDGLMSLSDQEIRALASKHFGSGPEQIARTLLNAVKAKNLPRQDNTTVQVVCIHRNIGAVQKQKSNKWAYGLVGGFIVIAGIFSWKLLFENFDARSLMLKNDERIQSSPPAPVAAPIQVIPSTPEHRPIESRSRNFGEIEKGKPVPKAKDETRPPTRSALRDSADSDKSSDKQPKNVGGSSKDDTKLDSKPANPTPTTLPTQLPKDEKSQSEAPGGQAQTKDLKPVNPPAPVIDRSTIRNSKSDEAGKSRSQSGGPQSEANP